MNFEGGFFLTLGLIFILPALYWLSRLVNWVAGRKLIPLWLLATLTVAALAGGSLYLDAAGIITPVKVVDKSDTINLGRNGSWHRNLSVQVEYQSPGEYTPTPIGLRCEAATFDALRIGQTVEARVLDLGQVFKFARLKDRSTFSLIADRFSRSPRGPWRESTAVITEVTHIAEYSSRRSVSQLPWPFDIVQIGFTPDGRDQPVTAVDVVESASAPGLVKGGTVRITWPEDDPRSAKIIGARPGSPWANWFYGLGEILAIGVAVIAFFAVIGLRRRRRRTKETTPMIGRNMKTFLSALFSLFIFLSRPAAADAQTTPSASDDEQDFVVPARPTFSNPAEFQRPGVLQLEYGYNANFHAPGVSVAQDTPLALRFAASSRFLLELDSDLVISQSAPGGMKATGFGDMQLGIQGVLEHEKERRPGVAVAYYVKLPTASSSKGLGTGRVDHNFVALVSKKFGQTVVDFNAIYLLAGSAIERGRASSAQGALAFSHNLTRRTGVQGEISGFSRNDIQPGAVFGLGVGTYQVNRRLVFDGGARFGITHDAPRAGLVAGLTVGVSDLYRKNKK